MSRRELFLYFKFYSIQLITAGNEVWGKVMFLHVSVILSQHASQITWPASRGVVGFPACITCHMTGGSTSRGRGSAYRGRGLAYRGKGSACLHCIQWGLHLGGRGLHQGGGLHPGGGVRIWGDACIQGVVQIPSGSRHPPSQPELGKRAVHILLECFLVLLSSTLIFFNKSITSIASQIVNELYYIKHCWGVYEQNNIVISVRAGDWTVRCTIIVRNVVIYELRNLISFSKIWSLLHACKYHGNLSKFFFKFEDLKKKLEF